MPVRLIEYGDPRIFSRDELPFEGIRKEALYWKQALGLRELPIAVEYAGPNRFSLRAQGVAGILDVDGTAIEVQPKFLDDASLPWRQALFHILAVVEAPLAATAGPIAGASPEDAFPDLLGHVLVTGMARAREEGYPRSYTEVEGTLDALRGRLDTRQLPSFLISPHKVPCIYDEYGEDAPVNRLLRWAAYQLAGRVRSQQLAQRLSVEADALPSTTSLPPGLSEADGLILPPQHGHLQDAVDAARLLLRQNTLRYQEGDAKGFNFLWKSHDVFEQFGRHLLSEACASAGWDLDKPTLTLATATSGRRDALLTIPDYRIRERGNTVLILDAKYKLWPRSNKPEVDNVYQIMASGRLLGCDNVCLIYPKSHNSPITSRSWEMRGHGAPARVSTIFIDLMQMASPTGEAKLIHQLRQDISTVLSS